MRMRLRYAHDIRSLLRGIGIFYRAPAACIQHIPESNQRHEDEKKTPTPRRVHESRGNEYEGDLGGIRQQRRRYGTSVGVGDAEGRESNVDAGILELA